MTEPLDSSERRALRKKARTATINALQAFGGEAQRSEIEKWARANGGFNLRELGAPPPERANGKHRDAVDHQLSWMPTNLKREGLLESPKWSTWRLTSRGISEAAAAAQVPLGAQRLADPVAPERLAELRAMPYPYYLKTPEWHKTRDAALLRAGHACSLDATHTENLDVHHRSYERLGTELTCDLVVLCRPCHQLHHKRYGRPRRDHAASPPAAAAVAPMLPAAAAHTPRTGDLAAASTVEPSTQRKRSWLWRMFASLVPASAPRDTRP